VGASLLGAGLAGGYLLLAGVLRRRGLAVSTVGLAVRSAAAHRGRSLLAVGLLACAAFVMVTVAANERRYGRSDVRDRASGTGGFALRAVTALPVHYDLGTRGGRAELGFPESDEAAWAGVEVHAFLMSRGEDVSCLNLARPARPRVLGVRDRMIARGGFTVRTETGAGWQELRRDLEGGAVPAFGDAESVKWQLHSGLSETYAVPAESGRSVPLRFTGLVRSSILAGELLVSADRFRELFPSEAAPRYFLLEVPAGQEDAVARSLRRHLADTGVEVRRTRSILNDLIGVQNTYLMTFLALGGLGVVLGTVGLVVVVFRNALERRGEFALMLATGFRRRYLAGLLVLENAVLLGVGLAWGAGSALLAVLPQLRSVEAEVSWLRLGGVLGLILVVGLAASGAAAAGAARGRLVEALRAE
jgi:hypothetical protein